MAVSALGLSRLLQRWWLLGSSRFDALDVCSLSFSRLVGALFFEPHVGQVLAEVMARRHVPALEFFPGDDDAVPP
jgi:hypothetical protein